MSSTVRVCTPELTWAGVIFKGATLLSVILCVAVTRNKRSQFRPLLFNLQRHFTKFSFSFHIDVNVISFPSSFFIFRMFYVALLPSAVNAIQVLRLHQLPLLPLLRVTLLLKLLYLFQVNILFTPLLSLLFLLIHLFLFKVCLLRLLLLLLFHFHLLLVFFIPSGLHFLFPIPDFYILFLIHSR